MAWKDMTGTGITTLPLQQPRTMRNGLWMIIIIMIMIMIIINLVFTLIMGWPTSFGH